jgi:two-component system, LytTR family, response regulator LytT
VTQALASALIVDDDAPAVGQLRSLLRTFCLAPVDVARDVGEVFRCLQRCFYDVVFLDVRASGLDGIELGSILSRFAAPPALVIVTGCEEYAVRAFEIGACDYLLKPVSRARLATALERALDCPPGALNPAAARPRRSDTEDLAVLIPVENGGRTRFVSRDAVRWVEAEGDYVRLHTEDGEVHLVRIPISRLQAVWAAHGFIRIHRGYLVPSRHITEFSMSDGVRTVTIDGHALPVSRRHAREVRDSVLRAGWWA